MAEEKLVIVSVNGKEINRIPLKDATERKMTVKSIVMKEIEKSPEIQAVEKFFVKVNGKKVVPRDVRNMDIENVGTIEIFDGEPTT